MAAVKPIQPTLKEGGYDQEQSSFGDLNNIFKFFATKKMRYSHTSPPLLRDVPEGEFIWDKTLNRLYTQSDGSLRYVQFT